MQNHAYKIVVFIYKHSVYKYYFIEILTQDFFHRTEKHANKTIFELNSSYEIRHMETFMKHERMRAFPFQNDIFNVLDYEILDLSLNQLVIRMF